jgi:gliding motility-associated-like protein
VTSIPGQGNIRTIKSVQVFDVKLQVLKEVTCFGAKQGSLQAIVSGSGNFFYLWDQLPGVNAAQVSNLPAGAYTLTVASDGDCRSRTGVVLTQPDGIEAILNIQGSVCGLANGNVHAQISGGTSPYSYEWRPGGVGLADLNSIRGGQYELVVKDANDCADTIPFLVKDTTPMKVNLGPDLGICEGQELVISGGEFSSYQWQDGSTQSTFLVKEPGTYVLRGFDASGCSATDSVTIARDCSEPSYPNAFSPNGDGLNDRFGASGNLSLLTSYRLTIWNRWGTRIFTSTNPNIKWNGGGLSPQTFLWMAEYSTNGTNGKRIRRGTVTLVR